MNVLPTSQLPGSGEWDKKLLDLNTSYCGSQGPIPLLSPDELSQLKPHESELIVKLNKACPFGLLFLVQSGIRIPKLLELEPERQTLIVQHSRTIVKWIEEHCVTFEALKQAELSVLHVLFSDNECIDRVGQCLSLGATFEQMLEFVQKIVKENMWEKNCFAFRLADSIVRLGTASFDRFVSRDSSDIGWFIEHDLAICQLQSSGISLKEILTLGREELQALVKQPNAEPTFGVRLDHQKCIGKCYEKLLISNTSSYSDGVRVTLLSDEELSKLTLHEVKLIVELDEIAACCLLNVVKSGIRIPKLLELEPERQKLIVGRSYLIREWIEKGYVTFETIKEAELSALRSLVCERDSYTYFDVDKCLSNGISFEKLLNLAQNESDTSFKATVKGMVLLKV